MWLAYLTVDNELSDNKLSDNNFAGELVESMSFLYQSHYKKLQFLWLIWE